MTPLAIRRATLDEVDEIAALWQEAAAWLATTGSDQWQYPVRIHAIRQEVADGTAWIVRDDHDRLLATVTLEDADHSRLWTPDDPPGGALYVHRLVVARHNRPADLGSAVLDWAARHAAATGRSWLRLDAWTGNTALHRYYRDRGFRHVRTVDQPDIRAGALFDRPAAVQLGRGPALHDEQR